ncbi:MAG: protein kinase [Chloroflexota bacterium]
MTIELYFGDEFDTPHERKALDEFMAAMKSKFDQSSDLYLVLANYYVDGRQLDLTVLKRNAIIIIDLKECHSPIRATENGEWVTITDGKVIGTGGQNPFAQIKDYRFKWVDLLKGKAKQIMPPSQAQSMDFMHVSGIVAISPILHPKSENHIPAHLPWFKLVGLDGLADTVAQQASKKLNFPDDALRKLATDILNLKQISDEKQKVNASSPPPSTPSNQSDTDLPTYISLDDAAFRLGIPYRETYQLARSSQIRSRRKDGGHLQVLEDDVVAYEEAQAANQPDKAGSDSSKQSEKPITRPPMNVDDAGENELERVLTGDLLQNRYKLLRRIKEGGYGTVYEGVTHLGAQVALKRLTQSSEKAVRAFKREATILAQLNHSGLPRVFDHFEEGDYYLVMDYITGIDLAHWFETNDLVSETRALEWAKQLLDTLVYLHQESIIHRDVKPANIIIKEESQNAILVDLGIASVGDDTYPVNSRSRYFSAPEQTSHSATPQSDIYGLGATLYFLLAGEPPLDAEERKPNQPLTSLRDYNPTITRQTESIIMKALGYHLRDRWQSAKEMLSALKSDFDDIPTGQTA